MPRAKESVLLGLRPQLSWTISFFGRDRNDFYARNAFFAASGALATFTTPEKSIAPKKPVPKGRQAPKVSERSDAGEFEGVRHLNHNRRSRSQTKRDGKFAVSSLGVRCGARTHDTQNHNLVLYQLN